jgi:hypothetical protein
LVVSEFHESFGDVEVARLVLPIMWFPVNQVVTYPFPMITRHANDETPMLLLDIHLSRVFRPTRQAASRPDLAFMNPKEQTQQPTDDAAPSQPAIEQPPAAERPPAIPMAVLIAQELANAQRRPPCPR